MSSKESPLAFPTSGSSKLRKSGSNVRGPALAAFLSDQSRELQDVLVRHRQRLHRRARKLISKRELSEAVAFTERLRTERNVANFQLGPEASKWRSNKLKFGKRVTRELQKNVRNYRELRALADAAESDLEAIAKKFFIESVATNLSPFKLAPMPDLGPSARVFRPPFAVFDVSENTVYPNRRNDSFAWPRVGYVINDVRVSMSEHTSVFNGLFGLDAIAWAINRAGCGFNFTMPRSGRLRIVTQLRHFQTRIRIALSDNFGFSWGSVYAGSHVYVHIIRGSNVVELKQTLVSEGLVSHGSDLAYDLPAPDGGTVFTFDATTDETFGAGDAMQIIAGCEFSSSASLDDMEAIAEAFLWHEVQQIAVDVV